MKTLLNTSKEGRGLATYEVRVFSKYQEARGFDDCAEFKSLEDAIEYYNSVNLAHMSHGELALIKILELMVDGADCQTLLIEEYDNDSLR